MTLSLTDLQPIMPLQSRHFGYQTQLVEHAKANSHLAAGTAVTSGLQELDRFGVRLNLKGLACRHCSPNTLTPRRVLSRLIASIIGGFQTFSRIITVELN